MSSNLARSLWSMKIKTIKCCLLRESCIAYADAVALTDTKASADTMLIKKTKKTVIVYCIYINHLVTDCSNSISDVLELPHSCLSHQYCRTVTAGVKNGHLAQAIKTYKEWTLPLENFSHPEPPPGIPKTPPPRTPQTTPTQNPISSQSFPSSLGRNIDQFVLQRNDVICIFNNFLTLRWYM